MHYFYDGLRSTIVHQLKMYHQKNPNNIHVSNNETSQKFFGARIQFLDGYKSLSIRLPSLSASESKQVIDSIGTIAGPLRSGGQSIETIGPTLGVQLLQTTLKSLFVAFFCVAIYISIRFDRRFSFFALLAFPSWLPTLPSCHLTAINIIEILARTSTCQRNS